MSVSGWVESATAVETYEPFEGALRSGTLIGSPEWGTGVDGQCIRCEPDQGAVIDTTAETARGYPLTVSVWFAFDSVARSTAIYQWGSIPSVGAHLFGSDSTDVPGSIEVWVRMSNGRYALRVKSGALAANRWHCLTVTAEWTTIWGGCRANAYVNGQRIGSGSYSGGLFDVVNFNRPTSVTIGTGPGRIAVDEFVTQETELSSAGAVSLYDSADSLSAGATSGWGVYWS